MVCVKGRGMAEHSGASGAPQIGWVIGTQEGDHDGGTIRYADAATLVREAEEVGLDSLWLPDHFFDERADGSRKGMWEAFTFLSALAATTSRIELGTLVAATSFRNPGLLAKIADGIDEISDGRFILGVGSGWHQPEYEAFGYPFDHLAARFEESLRIFVPLLREGSVGFQGRYVSAHNAVLRPRSPSPQGPKLLIAARRPRMLRLAAQYADAWHTAWHVNPQVVAQRWAQMCRVCAEMGRDPETLELTCGVELHILLSGEPRPAENELDGEPIVGTSEEVAEALRGFVAVGVKHFTALVHPQRDAPRRL